MKYYLIVGEASGDLHASRLMAELKRQDNDAQFRFFGGDMMRNEGGTLVRHYKDLAYMGFMPVLMHLPTILGNMRFCKQDIIQWNPDVLILVDYPGFNLDVAKYIKSHTSIPIYYYISPKIWAWKEYRIKNIKRDIDHLFSILPFEIDFFERKHNYHIDYVGNPTVGEVDEWKSQNHKKGLLVTGYGLKENLITSQPDNLTTSQPHNLIALLAGSRRQEIKDNLPMMLKAAKQIPDYRFVIAGAPGIEREYYDKFIAGESDVEIVFGKTYELLHQSVAALVTSGTATLETALFNVPQVVCYYTPMGKFISWCKRHILKVKYISLVNLIVDRELVTELVADTMTVDNICHELTKILPGNNARETMLDGYMEMRKFLGSQDAAQNAAHLIVDYLKGDKSSPLGGGSLQAKRL